MEGGRATCRSEAGDSPRLVMRGVRKAFGPTQALDGVDFEAYPAEVHALVGENGAGKSTLMKVLAGAVPPDAGSILLDGRPYRPLRPEDGRRAGVAMIYQELNLAPDLSVEANIFLGVEKSTWGFVQRREEARRAREALELLGHVDIDPHTPVRELGVGARQLVEIARALVEEARVIIFDEPTSSLTRADTERLFRVLDRLKKRGVAVVYISHFLEEVFEVADRWTVLRNGRSVGTGFTRGTDPARLVELMVGRPLGELFPKVPHTPGEVVLELEDLAGEELPGGVDLVLRRGEILGIAGLVGAGRTEMLRAVYGLDPVRRGSITVCGVKGGYAPPDVRVRQGVGFLSENRQEEGLALEESIAFNITLVDLRRISRLGWILPGRERAEVLPHLERLRVARSGELQPAGELSGGNQQKVAFARLLYQRADVLLLDEPTRGIDVASKVEVYRLMGELAAEGKGVLFVSSYLPELLGVADRIGVFYRGRLAALKPASEWSEEELLLAATGAGAER